MRLLARSVLALAISWPLPGAAQTQAPAPIQGGALPAGHPPVAPPPGHPPVAPAGHPPMAPATQGTAPASSAAAAPAGSVAPATSGSGVANPHAVNPAGANPHAANPRAGNPHGGMNAPRDTSSPDASVPKGGIVATIVDGAGQPLPGVTVRLGKMFQSIAQGDQRDSETQKSNAQGEVSFSNLETASTYSYRVTVEKGSAEYTTTPFRLAEDRGQRVLLHVYPVTSDLNEAQVMMRGLVYVEARDDAFQFEVWFQVYNVGGVTWVPAGVGMELPEHASAFTMREGMADTRFESDGDSRLKLLGTFSPGQHDIRFNFQVDNPQDAAAAFELVLPPRVGEFRVVAQAIKGMTLSARDFPPVQTSVGPQGERVLVTQMRSSDQSLDSVHFELAGLPTRGNAPWVAVLLALATAGSGVYVASQAPAPSRGRRRKLTGELKKARDVLLNELVQLEQAKAQGKVGPQSYEHTRRALVTALARIVQPGASAAG